MQKKRQQDAENVLGTDPRNSEEEERQGDTPIDQEGEGEGRGSLGHKVIDGRVERRSEVNRHQGKGEGEARKNNEDPSGQDHEEMVGTRGGEGGIGCKQ